MKNGLFNRIVSAALALLLVAGAVPVQAFAEALQPNDTVITQAEVQPEPPAATEAPLAAEKPAATELPAVTEVPVATAEPEITEVPAATQEPMATEEPVATQVPETEPEEETEPVVVEYTAQTADGVQVTAQAAQGVLPEGARLEVKPLSSEDPSTAEQYAQAQEALAQDGQQAYDGFLAFDITFYDLEGQPVEPTGEVSVSMQLPEQLLPENADPDTLAVQHHAQQADQVSVELVASADQQTAGTIGVQEQAVAAAFVVDSFSSFTITYNTSKRITIRYIDKATQQEINVPGAPGNITIRESKEYDLKETFVDRYPVANYTYQEAWLDYSNSSLRVQATHVRYNHSRRSWQYSNGGNDWNNNKYSSGNDNGTVWLLYSYSGATPSAIETVDSVSNGITINAFNYTQPAINQGKSFHFNGGGGSEVLNKWTGTKAVVADILASQLVNGYPVLSGSKGGVQNESLAYLFDLNAAPGKTVYANRNHLFLKSVYDATGYFEYDSAQNFATLMAGGSASTDFTVYDQATSHQAKFMPFNRLKADGTLFDATDFHFGMNVSFNFIQPKNGMVNGQPMVFEFNGDDDLWVFVDGKLVLDLGGIHDAVGGSINFQTGEVTVDGSANTNLKTRLGLAGNTLENYTKHNVQIYYLERGMGASNCRIRFNIPAIPEGQVYVGKQITNDTNSPEFADSDFSFKVQVSKYNAATGSYGAYQDYKGSYQVYNGSFGETNRPAGAGSTQNGEFTLKNNQYAVLKEGITSADKYRVVEYEPDLSSIEELYSVVVGSKAAKAIDLNDGTSREYWGQEDLLISENQAVMFTNGCKVANLYNLVIEKKMAGGASSSDPFNMQLTLGGKPYSGEYFVDMSGSADLGEKRTTSNGIIPLKAGEKATIQGAVWGSSFTVVEQLPSGYYAPTYQVSENVPDAITLNRASGVIPKDVTAAEKTVRVIVTNTSALGELTVSKQWQLENGAPVAAPANASKVVLELKQWYLGDGGQKQYIPGSLVCTIQKDSKGSWVSAPVTGAYYFTEFEVVSETVYDALGQKLTDHDFTLGGFSFDRNYDEAKAALQAITPKDQNEFDLAGTNFVLVKTTGSYTWSDGASTGSVWYLCMPQSSEAQANAVIEAVKKTPGWEKTPIVYRSGEVLANSPGITLEFGEGGNSHLAFDDQGIWSQFAFGGFDFTGVTVNGTLTNKLDITKTVQLPVTKVWDDSENPQRPASVEITLQGSNGVEQTETFTGQNVLAGNQNQWQKTFEVAKYKADGTPITYTVEEKAVPESYVVDYDQQTLTVTNSLQKGSITVRKSVDQVESGKGDAVFSFKLTSQATGQVRYAHFQADSMVSEALAGYFGDLPAGIYTVEELDTLNYKESANRVTNAAAGSVNGAVATVDLRGTDAVVYFNNVYGGDHFPGDSSATTNKFGTSNRVDLYFIPGKLEDEKRTGGDEPDGGSDE